MELEMTERDGTSHITLQGRLDTPGVGKVETRFTAAAVATGRSAIVDLTKVTFISSMGIRMLLTAARALALRKSKLILLGPQPFVREALDHTGLPDLISVAATEAEAFALLGR